jgi:hypothetical protein
VEQELFDWSGWDGEVDCMTFYGVCLKVKIGDYDVGSRFDLAVIMQIPEKGQGVLQFLDKDGGLKAQFKLHYLVGEEIS